MRALPAQHRLAAGHLASRLAMRTFMYQCAQPSHNIDGILA